MIIYAVIIIKTDGTTLLTEYFQSDQKLSNKNLIGGLLVAMQGITEEISFNNSEMKTFEIEGFAYHIRSFGIYRIVLITDLSKEPDEIIQKIGFRFMKEFGKDLLEKDILTSKFDSFKDVIEEIIGTESYDEGKSLNPAKLLNTKAIFHLPNDLQPVALAMLLVREGTVNQISIESNIDEYELADKLEKLHTFGYVGKKKKNDQIHYFCTTF